MNRLGVGIEHHGPGDIQHTLRADIERAQWRYRRLRVGLTARKMQLLRARMGSQYERHRIRRDRTPPGSGSPRKSRAPAPIVAESSSRAVVRPLAEASRPATTVRLVGLSCVPVRKPGVDNGGGRGAGRRALRAKGRQKVLMLKLDNRVIGHADGCDGVQSETAEAQITPRAGVEIHSARRRGGWVSADLEGHSLKCQRAPAGKALARLIVPSTGDRAALGQTVLAHDLTAGSVDKPR